MKKLIIAVLALMLTATIVFGLAACGGKDDDVITTAADTTAVGDTTTTETTTAPQALTEEEVKEIVVKALGEDIEWDGDYAVLNEEQKETIKTAFLEKGYTVAVTPDGIDFSGVEAETTTEEASTMEGDTTQAATEANKVPTTKAEILAAYTAVMNKAKTSKPAYKKIEYQALPSDKINVEKASLIITPLLRLAGKFMTTEEKARKEPSVYQKGNDMNSFPIKDSTKGCLLTDDNAIKSAKCDVLANGNYKITIVLKDEKNPEHYRSGQAKASSNTGNMFAPLSKSDVDPELESGLVKATVTDAKYDMYYYNCTATLEYNPITQSIVTLDMVTYTRLVMEGKVIRISAKGEGVLEMYLSAYDFKY